MLLPITVKNKRVQGLGNGYNSNTCSWLVKCFVYVFLGLYNFAVFHHNHHHYIITIQQLLDSEYVYSINVQQRLLQWCCVDFMFGREQAVKDTFKRNLWQKRKKRKTQTRKQAFLNACWTIIKSPFKTLLIPLNYSTALHFSFLIKMKWFPDICSAIFLSLLDVLQGTV